MKGFFTQGAALLTSSGIDLPELELLVRRFGEPRSLRGSQDWALGGAGVLVPVNPKATGYVAIDFVARKWPDHMGDPESEPSLFAAWSTGHFGPFAYPRGLERAGQHAWSWPEASEIAQSHRGFVRLKVSYCFGARPSDPILPEGYEPLAELRFVTDLAAGLSAHPAVLCYFNPSGETLLSPEGLREALAWADSHRLPPLDVWSNVRLFNPEGLADGWCLMDTVGMGQLDCPDHEACYPRNEYEPAHVANFLRNAALYVITNGAIISDGDTMDGAGKVHWRAKAFASSISDPPRKVLRWFPVDGSKPPDRLLMEKSPSRATT